MIAESARQHGREERGLRRLFGELLHALDPPPQGGFAGHGDAQRFTRHLQRARHVTLVLFQNGGHLFEDCQTSLDHRRCLRPRLEHGQEPRPLLIAAIDRFQQLGGGQRRVGELKRPSTA